jgi:RNA polymerase sigma-70 factor (ECF subfamily)
MPLDAASRPPAHGRAAAGDAEPAPSFNDGLIALLPRLRVQALALTRNRPDADDLVQAAVTRALAAKAHFTPGTNLGAWVYRILRNQFLSDRRRARETVGIEDAPSASLAVSASQEGHIALQELRRHLGRLSPDHRTALVMVSVEGLSYQQVADAMGCPVGTAKCRVFRARRQLEAWLLGTDAPPAEAGAAGAGPKTTSRAAPARLGPPRGSADRA